METLALVLFLLISFASMTTFMMSGRIVWLIYTIVALEGVIFLFIFHPEYSPAASQGSTLAPEFFMVLIAIGSLLVIGGILFTIFNGFFQRKPSKQKSLS